ncbi:MAG: ABC transporter permease [Fimbriimonadaceae bacterium]
MRKLFLVRGKIPPRLDLIIGLVSIMVLAAIWCGVTYGGMIKPIFLPSPTGIVEAWQDFHNNGWLYPAILKSTVRVFLALLLVTAVGVPIGILMGSFPGIDAGLRKIVNGAKSVPTTGLVGLIVLWFSVEEKAKIVFLVLGSIFYMIILTRQAISSVSEEYVKVAVDIGASGSQVIRKVLIPGALPQIWDAIAVCNGIMWTYIVLAEFINNSEEQIGLGYLLYVGSRTQDSGKVFLTLFLVGIISAFSDWVFGWLKRRYFAW